ncbi:MAG TPA: YhjD/YihY/BrkB family envelope integrity protein, partial [Allocoleopsis sp.]
MELLKVRVRRTKVGQLLFRTVVKWQRDECLEMGAALSYYALFSIFPIFLVILSIFGFLLGPNAAIRLQILEFAQKALPPDAFQIVETTLMHLNQSSVGAGIVGFLL